MAGAGPTVADVEQALAQTGYSRFPVTGSDGAFTGYLHIKDVLALGDDPGAVVDGGAVRPLPTLAATMSLPDALGRMRRTNSHLALVTDGSHGIRIVSMVALEDLVEDLVGTVRDGTHRV